MLLIHTVYGSFVEIMLITREIYTGYVGTAYSQTNVVISSLMIKRPSMKSNGQLYSCLPQTEVYGLVKIFDI